MNDTPTPHPIIAELRDALGSMRDNFRDVRADVLFTDDDVREEATLAFCLEYCLDHGLEAYL